MIKLEISPKAYPKIRLMVPEHRFYLLSEDNQREYEIRSRILPKETISA